MMYLAKLSNLVMSHLLIVVMYSICTCGCTFLPLIIPPGILTSLAPLHDVTTADFGKARVSPPSALVHSLAHAMPHCYMIVKVQHIYRYYILGTHTIIHIFKYSIVANLFQPFLQFFSTNIDSCPKI